MTGTPPKLPGLPALWVYVSEDPDTAVRVQARQSDLLLWESTSHKHKWGSQSDQPITSAWFMAWAAMTRTRTLPQGIRTWDQFRTEIFGVTVEDTDDAPADDDAEPDATPTQPGPDPG